MHYNPPSNAHGVMIVCQTFHDLLMAEAMNGEVDSRKICDLIPINGIVVSKYQDPRSPVDGGSSKLDSFGIFRADRFPLLPLITKSTTDASCPYP